MLVRNARLNVWMAATIVLIVAPVNATPAALSNVLSLVDSSPEITTAYLDKAKYQPGDQMLITAQITDDWGIKKIEAQVENEKGWDTVNLILLTGNNRKGTWQGAWKLHDTVGVKEYKTKIIATDLSGQTAEKTLLWVDPVQSHPPEQIRPGTFQSGSYKFPDGLGIGVDAAASDKLKVVKTSTGGNAINANCAAGTGSCDAVYAVSDGGIGVKGTSTSNYGVYGYTSSNAKAGVMGDGGSGTGVYGSSSGGSGVYGSTSGNSAAGIYGYNPSSWGFGVKGDAPSGTGVIGTSTVYGVEGESSTGTGVWGASTSGNGVLGTSDSATGVWGGSQTGNGVYGSTNGNSASGVFGNNGGAGNGVAGISNSGTGIYGKSTSGYSGYFEGGSGVKIAGNQEITGQIKITGGSPGAGKVLASDASGLASWQATGGFSGCRVCVKLCDAGSSESSCGSVQCSDYSSGGVEKWAPLAGDPDWYDPDSIRISIQCK